MSTADEIAKLAQLREQGALSDHEFEQEKLAVLARAEQGAAPPPGPTKTSGLAILSLVLAVLFFIPVMPLIGAVLGLISLARLKTRPHLGGRGAAIGAIIAGFMIFILIQGIMAAVAIPAFVKFKNRSRAVEVYEGLDKLKHGAKAYFQADHYDKQSGDLLPKRFPPSSGEWVPATSCCDQGGKCLPDAAAWSKAPWSKLHFVIQDPHYFQYRFKSAGTNKAATATIEARGDLDCDGTYSSFKLLLSIDEEYGILSRGPITENEIE